jgi:spore germination protein PF
MTSFLKSVQILNVSGTAGVHFGDSSYLSPKGVFKISDGAGGVNVGAFVNSNTVVSTNPAIDTTLSEQPITGNN